MGERLNYRSRANVAAVAIALAASPLVARAQDEGTGDLVDLFSGVPYGVEIAGLLVALAAVGKAVAVLVKRIKATKDAPK